MKHAANYENVTSITLFAAVAVIAIYRAVVLTDDGASEYPEAGGDVDNISMAPTTYIGEAFQGAQPTGAKVKIEAGAPVAINDLVAADAEGRAVPAEAGDTVIGKAVTAAGAIGEVIAIMFTPKGTAA